jgi:TPP-dependent pyruvate/acetoin dehydrogenase alpha subunit
MEEEVQTEIADALEFAINSPWPQPEEAWEDVNG